ncbi:helix-turn-helix transcriptional regulator [Aminipila terrae]|uniref:helix-turn-helix transcriptional regulator n=1 Tax=Aminipila terrae TaxID=2697030 RepID=UPI002ED25608
MQINRLFQIIYILLDRKSITASALSEKLEVSVRTIYRDVEVLSSVGVPVYMSKGKGGGYLFYLVLC